MTPPRWAVVSLAILAGGCGKATGGAPHRERDASRDAGCVEPGKPHAYFYAASDRTHYEPDDPFADGCALLVADHLFCCPNAKKPTDR